MQRIRMTKGFLNEFARCQRSFVMTLFHHGLDNASIANKGGVLPDMKPTYDARRKMALDTEYLKNAVDKAGGCTNIEWDPEDGVQKKIDMTRAAIGEGGPKVICDGMLEGGDFIVPFSILIVKEDGSWDVIYQSTKVAELTKTQLKRGKYVYMVESIPSTKTMKACLLDTAPLMYVLSNSFKDKVDSFFVVAADKDYVMPYPDPTTGVIEVDPNEAMRYIDMTEFLDKLNEKDWGELLGSSDPAEDIAEIQEKVAEDPFWIPDDKFGESKCGPSTYGYDCPFKTYCRQELEDECPSHLKLRVPYHDFNRMKKLGYKTMEDFLELSYMFPCVPMIEKSKLGAFKRGELDLIDDDGKEIELDTLKISTEALRELRAFEEKLSGNNATMLRVEA